MASVICVWLCRARRAPARGTGRGTTAALCADIIHPFIPPAGYAESKPLVVHDVPGSFPIAFISSSFRISRTGTPVPTMTFYSVWVLHMVNRTNADESRMRSCIFASFRCSWCSRPVPKAEMHRHDRNAHQPPTPSQAASERRRGSTRSQRERPEKGRVRIRGSESRSASVKLCASLNAPCGGISSPAPI